MAEYGHICRVAAELRYVVAHPLERGDDVQLPGIPGIGVFRPKDVAEVEITKGIQPMGKAHDDDIVLPREMRAVVARIRP